MTVRAFPQIGVVHLGTAQSLRVFFRKQAWHGTHVVKVFLRDVFRSHNRKAVVFAAYTLLCLVGILGGVAVVASLARQLVVCAGRGGSAAARRRRVLSSRQVVSSRKWLDFFPLLALYLTYGIARAKALLSITNLF